MINRRAIIMRDFARSLATLSKCEDKQNAAIICNKDMDQIYAIGINGGPKGGKQCLCNMGQKYTCVHAEANAFAKCSAFDRHKVVFATTGPCVTCAAMIVNAGVDAVYIDKRWYKLEGEQILRDGGVDIIYVGDAELNGVWLAQLADRCHCNIRCAQYIDRPLTEGERKELERLAHLQGYNVAYNNDFTKCAWYGRETPNVEL